MAINTLPCDVLLEIFHLDLTSSEYNPWGWHRLVHVCRRWRQIIFASPLRLDLQIFCKTGTPVRKNLGVWPAIPICIEYRDISSDDEDNIMAALEHPDRLSDVRLNNITGSQLGKIAAAMRGPSPILTHLQIISDGGNVPALPSGFLGSAPRLREITLIRVPFPPTLLLSASDLVDLYLSNIPPTGYISPDTMVAHLAVLSRLRTLHIHFEVVTSHHDLILPPPITRTVLPALNHFRFSGVCEYLEDFVARIDTPQLDSISILYCDHDIDFEVLQFSEFINRSEKLKKTLSDNVMVMPDLNDGIDFHIVGVTTSYYQWRWEPDEGISICVTSGDKYEQILCLSNVLRRIFPILPDLVHFQINSELDFYESLSESGGLDDIEWLQVLHTFPSVETLFVCWTLAGQVCRALNDIDEELATQAFPALKFLCLEDQPISSVDNFVAVRRDSGLPVTVVNDTLENFEGIIDLYLTGQGKLQ